MYNVAVGSLSRGVNRKQIGRTLVVPPSPPTANTFMASVPDLSSSMHCIHCYSVHHIAIHGVIDPGQISTHTYAAQKLTAYCTEKEWFGFKMRCCTNVDLCQVSPQPSIAPSTFYKTAATCIYLHQIFLPHNTLHVNTA